jgi:glycyl-tRNA synthetase beta chain
LRLKRGKLAAVGFQKGLGSMLDKAERVKALALKLCERLRQEVAFDEGAAGSIAELCYCDLVSEVVGEFPELQGAMGAVYARREGLGERVALGLSEFYFPVHARGPLPSHLEGCLASLAGKLDTVAALFAAGLRPSGSEDPYALRRQGNGAVRILLEKQVRVPAGEILRDALGLLGPGVSFDQEAVLREAGEFLWQRAETLFLEQGFKVDEIRAVREGGLDDLPRTYKRLAALRAMRKEADFAALALAFKRASNILRQAPGGLPEPDPARFVEISERALCAALSRVEGEVRSRAAAEEFEPALRALSRLKPDLDAFFDQVLVMAEDGALRANRLALLGRLVGLFKSVADVSQIQG